MKCMLRRREFLMSLTAAALVRPRAADAQAE
jgi:hypothetical protein